ncbi:hypothetical protein MMC29_002242 [Sticta canariensis]|nr:hypothetical protein [Sticta canariensis]
MALATAPPTRNHLLFRQVLPRSRKPAKPAGLLSMPSALLACAAVEATSAAPALISAEPPTGVNRSGASAHKRTRDLLVIATQGIGTDDQSGLESGKRVLHQWWHV